MTYDITTFGAVADGKTVCTKFIQQAIDTCAANGGGTVLVPAGNYITGTIFMRSHVELHLETAAVLTASTDLADYNADDAYPENQSCLPEEWNAKHLIIVNRCEDVALTGNGWLDGRGDFFFEDVPPKVGRWYGWFDGFAKARDKVNLRPGQLVCFIRSQHLRVENISARNATCWAFYFLGCEFVQIRGIKVLNTSYFANTDGIDIDCCHNVTISDCIIRTGDDCITLRCCSNKLDGWQDCANVTITNCVLSACACAFRIGVGPGLVRDARISNIVVEQAANAICFCCGWANKPSHMKNIHFSDITVYNSSRAIHIGGKNWGHAGSVDHVSISRVSADVWATNSVQALDDCSIRDVTLRDIDLHFRNRPNYDAALMQEQRGDDMLVFENVHGLRTENLRVTWEESERDTWRDVIHEVNVVRG
ncbi:MAG: hypothetical protein E7463_08350 [Ruminococcaceae bacterium]|nr:hypothetical protein [Oscillospiraceae bacterium]